MTRLTNALILLLLILTFSFTANAQLYTKVQGYVEKGNTVVQVTSTTSYKVQGSYPLATVTVYQKGTLTLATVYADDVGTPKSNPFTADNNGYYSFYTSPGNYDIKFSGAGITTPFTLSDVAVFSASSNVYSPKAYGAKCDSTTVDNVAFTAIITAISSTKASIKLPSGGACLLNNLTIPSNIAIDYSDGGAFYINSGNTLNIQGSEFPDNILLQRYYNALPSQGTLSLVNNKSTTFLRPEWFGGKGDKATNNASQFQVILNIFAAANKNPVIKLSEGVYNISNTLQDVFLSKAQVVLPKVLSNASQINVSIIGASTPSTPWNTDSGSIVRSTFTGGDGTGALIGVKVGNGSGCATATCVASDISSNITFTATDVTFRLPVNPSLTALDLSRLRNFKLERIRIDTDDFGAGGLNPNFFPATSIPDPICTEPTFSNSYGLKMITDYLPNKVLVDDIFIAGYYNAVRTGELGKFRNGVFHCNKVGLAVEGSTWPSHFEDLVMAATHTPIKSMGATPELSGYPDTNNNATIYIDQLGIENDTTLSWTGVNYVIDDAGLYLDGFVNRIFYGAGVDLPLNPALPRILTSRAERPHTYSDPVSNVTGTSLLAPGSDMAVFELYRRKATNTNTQLPWLVLTTNQSGTGNNGGIGVITFTNDSLPNGADHRVAQMFVSTGNTTNSGLFSFWTMGSGVLVQRAAFDDLGNFFVYQHIRGIEESLTISGGAITPTRSQVLLSGAGPLTTITVPTSSINSGNGTVSIRIIPKTAFTFNNTGNIYVPIGSGTAIVGRVLEFSWSYTDSKWYPSY